MIVFYHADLLLTCPSSKSRPASNNPVPRHVQRRKSPSATDRGCPRRAGNIPELAGLPTKPRRDARREEDRNAPNRSLVALANRYRARACASTVGAADPEWTSASKDPTRALGRRLFLREWVAEDPRARGGDGLGPVFNERSCVACHGIGGPGGAGTNRVNVELLTALAVGPVEKGKTPDRSSLATIHPGLAETGGIVLHRFGLSPAFPAWRKNAIDLIPHEIPGESPATPRFRLVVSRRNAPALFGAGRIDAIPDEAIEAEADCQAQRAEAEARRFAWRGSENKDAIKGKISRLKDGRIGRFGWKAQVPGLEDFVLTACANELGLEVPGHHQAADPLGYGDRDDPGLDLSAADCDALVSYVRALPSPLETPSHLTAPGRIVFDRIGCADCHRPKLGRVVGIYSDLLLHDMGQSLSDDGRYYGSNDESGPGTPKPSEWRTPPLWGLIGTGPYLHDGRAPTIRDAIAAHGGQAGNAATAFRNLSPTHQEQLLGFLRSLRIPPPSRLGPPRLTRRELLLESAETAGFDIFKSHY